MIFKNTVPILYSADVSRSLRYYVEVFGFESSWGWGEPPDFGGVSKNSVEIFFCEKGQGNPGTWISVMVDKIDEFYEMLKNKGAKILSAPKNMEWGLREMLVEDPDGHRIRFGASAPQTEREKASQAQGPALRILHRRPTVSEYHSLISAVGWSTNKDDVLIARSLKAAIFAVVAEDAASHQAIGCALVLGDGVGFYYLKDVMVYPEWQKKQVGTALMQAVSDWLEANTIGHSTTVLVTGERLAPFYRQFGFAPVFGMQRQIHQKQSDY